LDKVKKKNPTLPLFDPGKKKEGWFEEFGEENTGDDSGPPPVRDWSY